MVAAVVGIGSAVAGLAGSALSSSAASSAADTQAAAANQASQNALAQYQQTRSDLGPYRNAGGSALNELQSIFGLASPQAPQSAPQSAPQQASGGSSGGGLPNGWKFVPGSYGQNTGDWSTGTQNAQIVDANGNVVTELDPSATAADAAALYGGGGGGGAQSGAASAPAASSGPTGNPLAAYGLSGLTFNPVGGSVFTPVGGSVFNPTQFQLEQTPGYQFDLAQGQQGVANSNAAQGRGISGAALKGAASYATGLANNTLTTQQGIFNSNLQNQQGIFNSNLANQQGIFQQNLGNVLNPLEWMANLGQNAATTTGQQGISAVGNANNALVGGAVANSAGQVASANALSGGLNSVAGGASNYALYNNLLNGGGGGGGGGGNGAGLGTSSDLLTGGVTF